MTSTTPGTTPGTQLAHPATASSTDLDSAVPRRAAVSEVPRKVLVYSDDVNTRAQVLLAVGRRPASDLPPIEFIETATEAATISRLDVGDIDVAVLDGEAARAGGMGICRQIKDEIFRCPPVLLLIGRIQDGWLATWSRADAVAAHPLDPMVVSTELVTLLRRRIADVATAS